MGTGGYLGQRTRCSLAPNAACPLQEQRREEFVSSKRQIILLMEELDHTPDTSFERDVVCEDEESFCLSTDNIAALQSLLQEVRGLTRRGSPGDARSDCSAFSQPMC